MRSPSPFVSHVIRSSSLSICIGIDCGEPGFLISRVLFAWIRGFLVERVSPTFSVCKKVFGRSCSPSKVPMLSSSHVLMYFHDFKFSCYVYDSHDFSKFVGFFLVKMMILVSQNLWKSFLKLKICKR